MEFVGFLDNASEANKAVATAFATITTGACGGRFQAFKDIAFAFFKGCENRLNGFVLDSTLVSTGCALGDNIASQCHLGDIKNRKRGAICKRQLNRATLGGNDSLSLPDYTPGLELAKLTIFVTGIRLTLNGHNCCDCLICH